MAHRNHHDVQATESEVKLVYGSFNGANGANGTACKGCVVSATRAGEGDWDLVLRDAYPNTNKDGESSFLFGDAIVMDTTIGDKANVAAVNLEAKTATVTTWLKDGTADDVDAKTVRICLHIRNTTARRG
jgi:hypothetical protein